MVNNPINLQKTLDSQKTLDDTKTHIPPSSHPDLTKIYKGKQRILRSGRDTIRDSCLSLSLIGDNWGSYLGSNFPHLCCGNLFMYSCLSAHRLFVVLCSEFRFIKKMWISTHAARWSDPYDERDTSQ